MGHVVWVVGHGSLEYGSWVMNPKVWTMGYGSCGLDHGMWLMG